MFLDGEAKKEKLPHPEENMNMMDMNSKEKVNKIHLDEMQREAEIRQMLRQANQEKNLESNLSRPRSNIFLVIKALFVWPAALLHHRGSHSPHALK